MNIIIPIGGKGERFINKNYELPKPLIKVFDKTMIEYVIDNLNYNDSDNIFIIYRPQLDNYNFTNIINNKYHNIYLIKLDYDTNGAAETINYGINKIISNNLTNNLKCLLLDCDTFYLCDIIDKLKDISDNATFYFNDIEKEPIYSYINIIDDKIINIAEKIKISNNANTGAYYFKNIYELEKYTKHIIDNNIRFNNEYYTSCVIKEMINDNHIFNGICINKNNFISLGTPSQVSYYINNTYAFLFDLDGTIVNTKKIYFKVWNKILEKYNIILNDDMYDCYIDGNNDEVAMKMLVNNISNDDINNISVEKDRIFIEYINDIVIINNINNFIEELYKKGYKIGVVTNCNRVVAELILNKINISKYLSLLIIGNECIYPKPNAEPYKKAIEYLNISNSNVIIFEDSKTGITSAMGSNPRCIVGIEGTLSYNELMNSGVDIIISNYDNINIDEIIIKKNNNDIFLNKLKQYIHNSICNKYNNILDIKIDYNKIKGGYISDILKVSVILTNNEIIKLILKLENRNENSVGKMAIDLDLYNREYYFYETISNYIPLKIPKFYGIVKNDDFTSIGILLEDLNIDNFYLNLNLNISSIDISLKVLEKLAKLHATFHSKKLTDKFSFIKKNDNISYNPSWYNYIIQKYPIFLDKWCNILTENDITISNNIIKNFINIQQNILSKEPLTLCHGDIKSPNIFYYKMKDNMYEPYFIDWQYIIYGKGVQDLVFFMIESFEPHIINKYNKLFIEYYYIKLCENNVKDYSYSEYIRDFKASICYFPFFVAIWFGTTAIDELIDKNFPFFYIKKLYNFININLSDDFFNKL
jgi:beta-phosphoglucomutase-like phosphatase (HAD superfamily)